MTRKRNLTGNYTRIGVDLGGTKIEALALGSGGKELLRKRIPTPQGDYSGTLRAVAGLVRELEAKLGKKARVGVGMPGALSRVTGLVKNANSTCLIGHDLKGDLERALDREVRLANDANCFALSEGRGNIEPAAAVCERARSVGALRFLGPGCDAAGAQRARRFKRSQGCGLAVGQA